MERFPATRVRIVEAGAVTAEYEVNTVHATAVRSMDPFQSVREAPDVARIVEHLRDKLNVCLWIEPNGDVIIDDRISWLSLTDVAGSLVSLAEAIEVVRRTAQLNPAK